MAKNRSGQSPESSEIRITVDTALPDSPRSLSAESRPDGAVKLMWQRPLNKVVEGFNLYRLDTEFSDKTQAVKINSGLITSPGYTDLPTGEGTWFYRVLAVDAAGNESGLSNPAIAVSDNTPPKAVRIEYAKSLYYLLRDRFSDWPKRKSFGALAVAVRMLGVDGLWHSALHKLGVRNDSEGRG